MKKRPASYFLKWRKAHRKNRNALRKRNYDKSKPPVRTCVAWAGIEDDIIIWWRCSYTDKELSKLLGRSVQAIQQRRYKLKGKK